MIKANRQKQQDANEEFYMRNPPVLQPKDKTQNELDEISSTKARPWKWVKVENIPAEGEQPTITWLFQQEELVKTENLVDPTNSSSKTTEGESVKATNESESSSKTDESSAKVREVITTKPGNYRRSFSEMISYYFRRKKIAPVTDSEEEHKPTHIGEPLMQSSSQQDFATYAKQDLDSTVASSVAAVTKEQGEGQNDGTTCPKKDLDSTVTSSALIKEERECQQGITCPKEGLETITSFAVNQEQGEGQQDVITCPKQEFENTDSLAETSETQSLHYGQSKHKCLVMTIKMETETYEPPPPDPSYCDH